MQFTLPWESRASILNGKNERIVEKVIFCIWPRRITGTNTFVFCEHVVQVARYWRLSSETRIWKDIISITPVNQNT